MITLYHGSNLIIREIDLTRSKKGKDFGRGFYLNADRDQAYSMAERTYRVLGEGEPSISAFEFDLDSAIVGGLNIKIFPEYSEDWAEFVVLNRKNNTEEQAHQFDIVVGPIADDTVGVQIRRFVMGFLSAAALVEELRYRGDYSVQYFFGTRQALEYLKVKEIDL